MKRLSFALLAVILTACAHLPRTSAPDAAARTDLWHAAHMALYMEDFAGADSLFIRLTREHAETDEGREAVFYRGTMWLDPRNPGWNSERAETVLRRYLLQDTVGTVIHRRPEAITLLELARQLNLPADQRVAALAPERPPVTVPAPRRVAPADQQVEMQEEIERLRVQVAQRDEQIRRQREELDRIRRTLAPRTP